MEGEVNLAATLPAALPPEPLQPAHLHPVALRTRRRKTCLNGKRTCWKDRKKKQKRETQCNHIPQAAQQLVAADTTAQIPLQHPAAQQQVEKLKKRTTSHAGEEKERNKKNSPPMQPVFAAEVSNQKAAHLGMNPHQR
jgi:hypothetical protein